MPKIITAAMRAHLDEETTRLAAIWRIMLDDRRHRFYVRTTSSPGGIRRFNLLTGKEDFQVPYGTDMDPDGGTGWETGTYDLDGNVYLAADGGSDIIKADGDSLTHIETLESALFGYSDMDCGHAFTLGGFVPILFCATTLGSMRIVRADAPMALFVRAVAFPEDLTGSEAYAGAGAAAAAVMKLLKNDVEVGTVTFAIGSQTGTYDLPGGTLFAAGDRLAVTAPATADAALADVALGFKGVRAS